jgi:subtilase family serine protease
MGRLGIRPGAGSSLPDCAEEFGERFGIGAADLTIVEHWLESHGFTVESVSPSRMVIDFSGTAAQVTRTFHTEIHYFTVRGRRHIANVRDPAIPAALAPVIAGIGSLHDFRPVGKNQRRPALNGSGRNDIDALPCRFARQP